MFVIAEETNAFIGANRVPDPYSPWHNHIREKDPPYLPKVDVYDRAKVATIRNTFERIILPQVRSAWDNVLNRIP
jgi:hypothetical protein